MNSYKELRIADIEINNKSDINLQGYQLTGAQLFVKNLFNPNTLYKRLLINWQTGVGKSIAAISIGNEFIKQFQERYALGEKSNKMVCVLGFSTSETIQADLIKYPELGYVTEEEVQKYVKMLIDDDPKLSQYSAVLHRRLSDKTLGGNYRFFGYREFVNNLFIITEYGISNKITVQDLFSFDDNSIETLIEKKYITLNNQLLDSLKNGLIIADEIHNVYNSLESNNYGLAIQYVLDILKEEAPRAVFMSATPLTGNASEVIDLLNLLNPGIKLSRNDYFYKDSDGIYQLKSNALNTITELSIGKVSYLLDTDTSAYPERIFVGQDIIGIPYIKINESDYSELHLKALNKEKEITPNVQSQSYTLYDMVFPNPDTSQDYGLYNDIIPVLQNASQEWKQSVDLEIYTREGTTVISGSFLHKENLAKYSKKYYNVLVDILDLIQNKKHGKIMIYHHRVQLSGVLILQEIFRKNGFIDESEDPNNSTLCVICGVSLSDHNSKNKDKDNSKNKDHDYKPCRFIMAHSKLNKVFMKRNIAKFNDISNLHGNEYKLLIGSRIIREGLNFTAIRYQYILSLPINFPILIQVLGRVVRKFSHQDLPVEERNVYIKIFASPLEIIKYKLKAKEYLVIQEVERALRINAVDNFINYKRVVSNIDKLESLKFNPKNIEKPAITRKYFDAYKYNDEEILLIKKLISLLFEKRKVWTYNDIVLGIKDIGNVNYNLELIDSGNIELALMSFDDIINVNNEYYIKTTEYDIESYIDKKHNKKKIVINLLDPESKSINKIFDDIMLIYDKYLTGFIELTLLDFPNEFHIELLTRLIEKTEPVTKNDTKVINMYKRFRIMVNDHSYLSKIAVNVYSKKSGWTYDSFDTFEIGKRYEENSFLVGYVTIEDNINKFKLREPMLKNKYTDLRSVKKGMLCENYTRNELNVILNKLRKINNSDKNYAYKYDLSIEIKLSIEQMCTLIKLYMLVFEEKSREESMLDSVRWIYLFHDTLPNILIKK